MKEVVFHFTSILKLLDLAFFSYFHLVCVLLPDLSCQARGESAFWQEWVNTHGLIICFFN